MSTRTASRISIRCQFWVSALALLLSAALTSQVAAAPGGLSVAMSRAQNVDWMSQDQAAALDLPFPVMVPTFVPAPFSGSPAVQGSGDYYSLYWVNYGGPPTFLHITGQVGGSLPAGSPADLNIELSVNASVQGYEAIHDVTSIYDNVWWIAGDVLYTVFSNNMTGTDSLSLANSLIALEPPAAPEPEPEVPAPTEVPEPSQPDEPEQQEDEPSAADPEEEAVSNEPVGTVDESTTGDATNETNTDEVAAELGEDESPQDAVGSPETPVVSTEELTEAITDSAPSIGIGSSVDVSDDEEEVLGTTTLSDGTGGAALPSGGDGTGGVRQIGFP